jgi:hypothetical protein
MSEASINIEGRFLENAGGGTNVLLESHNAKMAREKKVVWTLKEQQMIERSQPPCTERCDFLLSGSLGVSGTSAEW